MCIIEFMTRKWSVCIHRLSFGTFMRVKSVSLLTHVCRYTHAITHIAKTVMFVLYLFKKKMHGSVQALKIFKMNQYGERDTKSCNNDGN